MERTCTTCYHHYHSKHTNTICRHTLMCNQYDKWEPYTNGDWIRTMSDKELADFLSKLGIECRKCTQHPVCRDDFETWVQEHKEDSDES